MMLIWRAWVILKSPLGKKLAGNMISSEYQKWVGKNYQVQEGA
jgi:hypothetical protein